ncbi:hypothetical protein O6H91_01G176200 [Diphasiastrum complanatum]|uniref:Uncharacterized protein n=1 Tax=Diphasiastrum complanatum TaxID=34168 RepID=A0ACC2EZ73_DIPCM|nr:hypothetical protein O6H91_01G176200 [Diphasiastrum complanatum]
MAQTLPSTSVPAVPLSHTEMLYKSDVSGKAETATQYLSLDISVGSKSFEGSATVDTESSEVASFTGRLYADDASKLYKNTVTFSFDSKSDKFIVSFFDDKDKKLGFLEAGAIKNVKGTGKGTGNWS